MKYKIKYFCTQENFGGETFTGKSYWQISYVAKVSAYVKYLFVVTVNIGKEDFGD